jgi:hypothetical protein
MATTYLQLTNRVLRELNETELTSSTFASSRGIQTAIKDFINKSIHDIYNEASEIPLLYARTTQNLTTGDGEYDFPADFRKIDRDSFTIGPRELVTNGEFTSNISNWTTGDGSPSYTSSGNGRLNLNDAAAYQSTFTATAKSSFIYVESDSVQLDVDYIRCSRSDTTRQKVLYISYDDYLQNYKSIDDRNDSDVYGTPAKVYILPNFTAFGVTPIPSSDEMTLAYNYYTTHTDLSAHGDTMALPDRFSGLITDRSKYYTYMLRSDPQHAQLADRDYQRKLRLLKTDYSTKADYMRSDVRIYNVISDR